MKHIKRYLSLIFAIIIVIASFVSVYDYFLTGFTNVAKDKEAIVNSNINPAIEFIKTATLYGETFFTNEGAYHNVELYGFLEYDSVSNSYNLDAVKETRYEATSGNITGLGTIPESGVARNELDLALSCSAIFSNFYSNHLGCVWVHYTSENDFVAMYPWVSSEDFKYDEALQTVEFYTVATPENDPLREAVWTSVYLDEAGKGPVVSLSSPIYNNDTFMGVLSIDFTCDKLSETLESPYDGYLIDASSSVIATDTSADSYEEMPQLTESMDISEGSAQEILQMDSGSTQRIGMYYVYANDLAGTPWTMVICTPLYSIIGKSLLTTLPIIIICALLFVAQKETERRMKAEEKIQHFAVVDTLTGLNNRYFLDMVAEKTMHHSDRYDEHLSAVMVDIDHFKKVNDTWGHPIGDEVLVQTADTIKNIVRKADILIRFGGEEFLILLPQTGIDDARIVAEKIRKAMETNCHKIAGTWTISLGVTERIKGESFIDLYRRVDDALYLAKESGRNCVVIDDPNKA